MYLRHGIHAVYLTGLFLAALTTPVQGQVPQKVVYQHYAFWNKTEVNEIFPNKFGVGGDFIFRTTNTLGKGSPFDRWHRTSFRPWVHYQVSKNCRFSLSPLGYFATQEYVGKESDFSRPRYDEWRTTLGFFHHHYNLNKRLNHTFRHWYEFRYRSLGSEEGFTFSRYRMRYRLRYVLNRPDFNQDGALYVFGYNEIMINYGQEIVSNMFSQNRLAVGMGIRFLGAARVELRLQRRFRSRASGFEYDQADNIMIGIFIDQFSRLGSKDIPVRYHD
ncbi:MAG: DUF2490 domain-containing protein [Bacteroidetes bacterium]|nr:DUF2490 domain-containing protein [Bacteroidota bacterium]